MSIYRRLFLWFCAANLLTLGVSVLIAHAIFARGADRPPDIDALVGRAQAALSEEGRAPQLRVRQEGLRAVLVRDGRTLAGEPLPRPLARHLEELTETDAELRLPRGEWLISRRLAPPHADVWLIAAQAAPRRSPAERWVAPAVQILLSLLAIAGVGWIVARHLGQPLRQMQTVVQRMAAGDLSARVDAPLRAREDEYGRLARDFDRMAARIETLVQDRDRLLHDVSHELRAPLSRLRFALELARDDPRPDPLERADREIARIDHLVSELLALARLDQAAGGAPLPRVDLRALAEDVVMAETPQARHRSVTLHLHAQNVQVCGDREALARALENLLRNAVRHSPAPGQVEVRVEAQSDQARISVSDRGPGVPAEELPQLFEPFFRGRGAASGEGYGLGLAIVARVMQAHRGRAEARPREGGGLEVCLSLPLG